MTSSKSVPVEPSAPKEVTLRPLQAGDYGWLLQEHSTVYCQPLPIGCGFNETFEAYVAQLIADFINKFQPEWERSWMALVDGERAGTVFAVKHDDEVVKLRMLILSEKARGLGIGKLLVDECVKFAREKGYKKVTLGTDGDRLAARRIYKSRGFELVKEEPHDGFGQKVVAEDWELVL
ncbi:MarR-family transcriptional regulator [Meredithblackwellia eburnea MCA 4105]